jgi:AraC-like DNA-binding protein
VRIWKNRCSVLSSNRLFYRDGIEIWDVACRHRRGRGLAGEQTGGHSLVFVRRGCFVRSVNGMERVLDPTLAYCINPGEEQRYDHPHDHGDDCTSLTLRPDLLASLWGGEAELPTEPFPVSPALDLEHRLLLSAVRRGEDINELAERAIRLTASALERADPRPVSSGRPATASSRRELADGVREILAANPDTSLPELARSLAVSAHHLSRTFNVVTGLTISRHRMRLRARTALERLADGEQNLARLAADVGFTDQSHLCRVIRQETASPPAALRRALA